jgi:hypothetical protein
VVYLSGWYPSVSVRKNTMLSASSCAVIAGRLTEMPTERRIDFI